MRYNKKNLKMRVDFNNMMTKWVGSEGFTEKQMVAIGDEVESAYESVQNGRGKGMMGWTELPYNQDEVVKEILETAHYIRKNFEYFVVLGIGGSALGPIAAFKALKHMHYNELPKRKREGLPKFYVEDNVDPERMAALLDVIVPEKTVFNIITKSGSTSETMTQYLIIRDMLEKKLGKENVAKHIIATTSKDSGNLIKIAQKEGYKTFYIPDGVGGRFSELSPVGLLPAAAIGIDIKGLLWGAAYADEIYRDPNPRRNAPLMAAVLQYLAMKRGKNISVMMPYADGLKDMADWYCQLWAESLGKNKNLDGTACNKGQTPVKALGVTDQHSQIQLYTEGPDDKVITFIAVEKYRKEVEIPAGCEEFPNVNFLCGHTMSELIQAERQATEFAVTKAGKPNHTIILPELNAFTLGELIMYFELQTAYAGALLGIDTFNQPGVEEGKNATYALLGRPGYEAKKAELGSAPAKISRYIV
ncbi:MAG TPA: glucose-6-phosphate isomerase [Candidatus Ornithoclostridium faecigallinarum]|nr:glucose-6-phosphate isomerase [Candidatus Ornithoclostridium faecigallinarum]